MRRAHILKKVKSQAIPTDAIWVDTETDAIKLSCNKELHVLREGMSCYRRQYARGIWCAPRWCEFTKLEQFWNDVESRLHGKIKLYIFAHNWSFDAPVLDLFNELPKRGWKLQFAVIESPPVIMRWKRDKYTIEIVDTLNIWRLPLKKLGDSISLPKLEMPSLDAPKEDWKTYNRRDVEIIMEACLEWFKFLRDYDLGGFAPTIAAQAFKTFRYRFMHDQLLIDAHETALPLARAGVFGGRTECMEIGKIKGDVYKLDINSMYPFIMKTCLIPTQLAFHGGKVSLKKLTQHLSKYNVTARVVLNTDENCYPLIHEKRLIFPLGEFETVLNTPELIYAIQNGHILSVSEFNLYFRARMFTDYIDFFYKLRLDAKLNDNDVLADQCKLFLNSLWGKFTQRGRYYEKIGVDDDFQVRQWDEIDAQTRENSSYRCFAGIVEKLCTGDESRYSSPAIGAHVTSNARMMLYKAMLQCGQENIYYCDTDSLWVNKTGYDNMTDSLSEKELGKFKLEGVSDNVVINGLKDYQFDDEVRIKGVKKTATKLADNKYEQVQFSSLKANIRNGDMSFPVISKVTKVLTRRYTKGVVLETGRVSPFSIIDGDVTGGL